MGNFVPIVAHNYASFYHRIYFKDIFFQTLLHDRAQKVRKNHWNEISKNINFWAKWAILTQLPPKIVQAQFIVSWQNIFLTLYSMIGHIK